MAFEYVGSFKDMKPEKFSKNLTIVKGNDRKKVFVGPAFSYDGRCI